MRCRAVMASCEDLTRPACASIQTAVAGAAVSQRRMAEVLLEQGEDPRVVYVARELIGGETTEVGLARAAAMGKQPWPRSPRTRPCLHGPKLGLPK
jgi:HEAT repeat protein